MVSALKRELSQKLSKVTEDPDFESLVILQTVFGKDFREKALTGKLAEPTESELRRVDEMLNRRLRGEPLQYIVGEWEFYGLDFKVGEGVLIPRQDTETVAEAAIELIKNEKSPRVADLCSGTGCIAAAIKHSSPGAEVWAIELWPKAYEILCENSKRYGLKPLLADVLSRETAEKFKDLDLITANPPYLTAEDMKNLQREVKFEPKTALFGGPDGLDYYRKISEAWRESLKPGGHMVFEIGLGREKEVEDILAGAGYKNIRHINDPTGRARAAVAER